MEILMVRTRVKPEHLEAYIREMIADAEGSVLNEPGCRRFDVMRDEGDPTKLGLCEVYNDEDAVEDHMSRPHFIKFREATKDWVAEDIAVSKCKPLFPTGDAHWDSARTSAVESEAFDGGLFIIHAPLLVSPDRVEDFIDALRLDAIGSIHEEPGCLRFDIYQNRENLAELYLYEVYVNKDAFDYHTRTPHIQQWVETVKDWYAPGFSPGDSPDVLRGSNLWPLDNWHWSSGHPVR